MGCTSATCSFFYRMAFEQDYFCINKEEKREGLIDFVVLETK